MQEADSRGEAWGAAALSKASVAFGELLPFALPEESSSPDSPIRLENIYGTDLYGVNGLVAQSLAINFGDGRRLTFYKYVAAVDSARYEWKITAIQPKDETPRGYTETQLVSTRSTGSHINVYGMLRPQIATYCVSHKRGSPDDEFQLEKMIQEATDTVPGLQAGYSSKQQAAA